MKRFLSLLLVSVLALNAVAVALADDDFDLSPIRNNDRFDISVNSEDEVAFITTTFSASDRSFVHEDEHPEYYSTFESDMIVLDYFSNDAHPVLRTWIKYATTEPLYPTAVTFTIDNKDYTFSGIGMPENSDEDETGVTEEVLIRYGVDSIEFLIAMDEIRKSVADDLDSELTMKEIDEKYAIPFVLHGIKDVTSTMRIGSLLDIMFIMNAFLDVNGDLSDVSSPSKLVITEK